MDAILNSLSYEIAGFFICFAVGVGMCVSALLTAYLFKWRPKVNEGARRPPRLLMLTDVMLGVVWGIILFIIMLEFNGAELRVYNFVAVAIGALAALFIKSRVIKGKIR